LFVDIPDQSALLGGCIDRLFCLIVLAEADNGARFDGNRIRSAASQSFISIKSQVRSASGTNCQIFKVGSG